jgi:hypothetical protein
METNLRILLDGRDKLVNIAECIHIKTEDKPKDKLAEFNEEILHNKGCVQNMAQMPLNSNDPDVSE